MKLKAISVSAFKLNFETLTNTGRTTSPSLEKLTLVCTTLEIGARFWMTVSFPCASVACTYDTVKVCHPDLFTGT